MWCPNVKTGAHGDEKLLPDITNPATIAAQNGIGLLRTPRTERRGWRFVRIGDTNTTQVECQGCGARGPHCMTNPVAEKNVDVLNALTAWNERVGDGDRLSRVDSETVQ